VLAADATCVNRRMLYMSFITPSQTTQLNHAPEKTRQLSFLTVVGTRNASCCGTGKNQYAKRLRKRTERRRPHSRKRNSGNAGCSLTVPASVSQKRLSILGLCSRREDAVRDALLLSAYRNLDQFKGQAQMSTSLTTIVTNSTLTRLRRPECRGKLVSSNSN
jgi:hypothetical protein